MVLKTNIGLQLLLSLCLVLNLLLLCAVVYWGVYQWCIAKNGGGYTQRGVAKGLCLKVPCLFMITEVSIRCQKNLEVGIRCMPAYTPQYTTGVYAVYQPTGFF